MENGKWKIGYVRVKWKELKGNYLKDKKQSSLKQEVTLVSKVKH